MKLSKLSKTFSPFSFSILLRPQTFKPNEIAKPVSGEKNFLSMVEEIKLEMECDPDNVNMVIDALLMNHPYEEIAYEIYDFKRRDKKAIGLIVNGYCKEVLNKLPMEFAVEAQKLLAISLEGSVG